MTKRRIKALACLALLVVLGVALAGPARDPVSGSGFALANMDTGEAEGEATLVIRGEELVASVEVTLGPPNFSDEGVLHTTSSHTFDFGDGDTITTSDKVVGEPTDSPGLLTLNEKLRIVSGTGAYEGASGNLTVHGQLQFISETEAQVTYNIRGAISR